MDKPIPIVASEKVSLCKGFTTWIEEKGCRGSLHRGPDIQIVVSYRFVTGYADLPTELIFCLSCHSMQHRWPEGPPPSPRELGLIPDRKTRNGRGSDEDSTVVRHRIIQKAKEQKQKKKKCVISMCTNDGVIKVGGLWACSLEEHQVILTQL